MADKVSFDVSPSDRKLIVAIAARAVLTIEGLSTLSTMMDVTACHANGCPLRLADLLATDDFNFAHDILGLRRFISTETGKLLHHFRPRFAVPSTVAA